LKICESFQYNPILSIQELSRQHLYFNWQGQGAVHHPPINTEWVNDLLRNTLEFDEDMPSDMGGAIRSEIFGAALIMMSL
jgi:hypothetical protein